MRTLILLAVSLSCFGQSTATLHDYLALSDIQVRSLVFSNLTYRQYTEAKVARATSVFAALTTEFSKTDPNVSQLTAATIEIELTRRDLLLKEIALQTSLVSVLNSAQIVQLSKLIQAADMRALASDASCVSLIEVPDVSLDAANTPLTFPASIIPASQAPYALRFVGDCGSPFPGSVRLYLNLTDSQIERIENASALYSDVLNSQQYRISDLTLSILLENSKPSPDPVVLGQAFLELHNIGLDRQAKRAVITAAATSSLNPNQATKLKVLQDSVTLNPLIAAALGCHLITLPPGTPNFGSSNGCVL